MPIPGIVIAAGIGAAASAANGIASSISTSNANSANREIADANNRTAIQINEANIRAQQEALEQQNQFNHDEAVLANSRELQKTFLLNRLNSPEAIAQRYRDAGMNPAVMMSGQSTIGASSPSAPQASAASSGISTAIPTLHSPTMQPVPSIAGGILNSVESMARAYKDLNSGNKEGAEADTIRGQLEARIREAFANAGIAEMNEEFTQVFGPSLQQAKLRESVASAAVDFAHAIELAKQGNVHDSQVKLNDTIASLNKAKEKLTGQEAQLYQKQIDWFDDTSSAKIKELLASANAQNANARYTTEQAAQLKDMREFNIELRRNAAQMSRAELMKQGATLYQEIDYMLGHFEFLSEADKADLQKVKAEADMAKWNYDMRWVNFALDTAERINNGVTNWIPFAPDKTTTTHSENVVHSDGSWRQRDVVESSKRSKGW